MHSSHRRQMDVSSQPCVRATFIFGGALCTHLFDGLVGPRTGLDILEKK